LCPIVLRTVQENSIYETKWEYNPGEQSYFSKSLNENGKIIANDEAIFHYKRVLDKKQRTIVYESYDRKKRLMNDNEHIARREWEFNDDNRKTIYKLFDENGKFAFHLTDYHKAFDYDERGNIIRVTSLDENGEKTYDDNGASIYEYAYDLYDRETSFKRFNKNHEPIVANDDYFQNVKEYDAIGRIVFDAYYYPRKVLKYNDVLWGATRYLYGGDSIVREYNIDAYGDVIKNENNVAIIKKRLNRKGNLESETYLDIDGSYAKMDDGIVDYKYEYDGQGRILQTASYDSLGQLKAFEADVAIVRWEYDNNGNKSKTTYFNTNNQLSYAKDSITYNTYKYNKDGKLMERAYYDINMKPALLKGVHKIRFLLNHSGLDSVKYEYDTIGKLKTGVAITRYYYNKYNNVKRIEYFDSSNRRTRDLEGVSATNSIYNKRQFKIGNLHFDENNRRTNNNSGVSFESWILNELGHTLSFRYLDKNSKPVIGPPGYHKIEYEWAAVGETIKTKTYGTDLSLIEDKYGTAIYEYDLRPSGLYTKIKRFNKDGKLADNSRGVSVSQYTAYLDGLYYLEKESDANGNEIENKQE